MRERDTIFIVAPDHAHDGFGEPFAACETIELAEAARLKWQTENPHRPFGATIIELAVTRQAAD